MGRTRGEGFFDSPLGGVRRTFTVDATGTLDGLTLFLRERIRYDDGQREEAVWRFDRTGRGRYDGQRTGIAGIVPVVTGDGGIEMGYVAEVTGNDGTSLKLRFDDRLVLTDPQTVLNAARVSFLGLPVGTVEVVFRR